jgi:hypothetical protein
MSGGDAICVMVLLREIHGQRFFIWCGDVWGLIDRSKGCRWRIEEGSLDHGRRGTPS